MELIHYWRVVRRWAWLIILCPLVAALAAGLISLQLPKMYEAKVSLYVRTAQLLTPETGVAPVTADQVLRTYADLMTMPPQLQKVISEESLPTDPESLSKRITVAPRPNTVILDVAVRDTDPSRAKRTADTLVNDFIAYVKSIQHADKSTQSDTKTAIAAPGENLVVASPRSE